MSYKIDVREIIVNHINTLKESSEGKEKIGFRDWFFFFFIPLISTVILIYQKLHISNDTSNALIAGLSIFIGLTINFLMIVFELSSKTFFKGKDQKTFLREIISNISFLTLQSIFIILLLLLNYLDHQILKYIVETALYFLLFNFLFTILMVIKRIYTLLVGIIDNDIT